MSRFSLDRRSLLGGLGATLALPAAGHAQSAWPQGRTPKLVVPFTPGGATDILGRLVADKVGQALGATFVVENRAGAGGNIGVEAVARSEPNGDTLLIVSVGLVANPALYAKVNYDPLTDFLPINDLVPGFDVSSWFALFAPAKTPPAVIAKIQADTKAGIADPAVRAKMDALAAEPVGNSPEELGAFLQAEMKRWGDLIKEVGLKVE